MKDYIKISAQSADSKENVEVLLPFECNVSLVRPRRNNPLRGIATIEYGGIVIRNIHVNENRGEVNIQYPREYFTRKNGNEGYITVARPSAGLIGKQFNMAILNEYSNQIIKNSNFNILNLNNNNENQPTTTDESNASTEEKK